MATRIEEGGKRLAADGTGEAPTQMKRRLLTDPFTKARLKISPRCL